MSVPTIERVETDVYVKDQWSETPEPGRLQLASDDYAPVGRSVRCRWSRTPAVGRFVLRIPPEEGPNTVFEIPTYDHADDDHAVGVFGADDQFIGYVTADKPIHGAGTSITLMWHRQDPDLWWVAP